MPPEARARQHIDRQLERACWIVQNLKRLNLAAGQGVAVRECPSETGPADDAPFVDRQPCGAIEAKPDYAGALLLGAEARTERYATSRLRCAMARAANQLPHKFGYPPNVRDMAAQTVLHQAEVLSAAWCAGLPTPGEVHA
jgi:hypothetical protein